MRFGPDPCIDCRVGLTGNLGNKVPWKGNKTVKPQCSQKSILSSLVISLANRLVSPAKQRMLRTGVNGRGRRPSGGQKELEQLMEHQQNARVS